MVLLIAKIEADAIVDREIEADIFRSLSGHVEASGNIEAAAMIGRQPTPAASLISISKLIILDNLEAKSKLMATSS